VKKAEQTFISAPQLRQNRVLNHPLTTASATNGLFTGSMHAYVANCSLGSHREVTYQESEMISLPKADSGQWNAMQSL
jgi:hypothetical protein